MIPSIEHRIDFWYKEYLLGKIDTETYNYILEDLADELLEMHGYDYETGRKKVA